MRTFRDHINAPSVATVVSIGNFDGGHTGHRALLTRLVARAHGAGASAAVVTFDPHPLKVLRPDKAPLPITTTAEKARQIERLGVDILLVLTFDERMAAMDPEVFLEDVIWAQLHPRLMVVGHDFNFGKDRKGTIQLLAEWCRRREIDLEVIDPVEFDGQRISSTEIRQMLRRGEVQEAAQALGRDYAVEGVVEKGAQRGATLGFPTANLRIPELLVPRGVYRGRATWDGESAPAAINVGVRPTFGDGETLVEVHILDRRIDLYSKPLHVEFHEWLRAERRFEGVDALKEQIAADLEAVRAGGSATAPTHGGEVKKTASSSVDTDLPAESLRSDPETRTP